MTHALAIFGLLIVLMAIGMPVGVALGLAVLSFTYFFTDVPLGTVALKMFSGIENFEIMAIPFFILAGNFLTHGGVARRMIDFASAMVGHLCGGLGMSAVLACALFAAVSGSSPATVVAIGSILIPAMLRQGFPLRFAAGVVASSGGLGILIPPSIVMVMYAVTTNSSVGALFMAGVVPGFLLAFMLGLCTWIVAKKRAYPTLPRASWGERWRAFRKAFWGLMLIVVVMGGIYSGIFTPTEAAAMSAVYAFFIAVFVYKDLRLSQIPRVLLDSANMSAMLLFIIASAVLFSFVLTSEQIPQRMADAIVASGMGAVGFLIVVNLMLLGAGSLMEPSSVILILAPILFPVAVALGINPIHFGVMIVVNMEIGMITPPVGLNLFVASGITNAGLTEMSKAVLPWLITMLVFLMLITYIPSISLVLPRALGMI
jgi:C4-dicarboxylate transporter DctM subunit